MPVRMRIDTDDLRVAFELMGTNGSLAPGAVATTPEGATVRFDRVVGEEDRGPSGFDFVVDRGGSDAGQLADWLYRRLNGLVDRVRIERESVPLDPNRLRRVLADHLGTGG